MSKIILIFADGTGQIGGMRPDQRLSNIYKIYRATRPGPDSPISPSRQVAFYDAGLGAGETGGFTIRRLRNLLSAAIGTGIDENVIDCYAAVIANYRPGDQICLFGFSRGAYTVRALANVMNLCGVPTTDGSSRPVPRYGPRLRKIATDAVRYVYNHGAGHPRGQYEKQREEKARRFRQKYACEGYGVDGEPQGNVQPTFIGVFDTVAALGNGKLTGLAIGGFVGLLVTTSIIAWFAPWWLTAICALVPFVVACWVATVLFGQIKYFYPDPDKKPSLFSPKSFFKRFPNFHLAWWSGKNYDRYVDKEIPYLRHALAIDETRADFQRVPWGRQEDADWNASHGNPNWLDQIWFAGNHSDIGGSYSEEESRLSDIALKWMIDELRAAVPNIQIRSEILVTSEDPFGLQHDERQASLDRQPAFIRFLTGGRLTWKADARDVKTGSLHSSVLTRLAAAEVPQMGEVKPYRPKNLSEHPQAMQYY